MIMISKYRQEIKNGKIYIRSKETSTCPICRSELVVIGSRNRKVILTDGTQQTLVVRRLRCKDCRHIHHELPDIIVPFKRHCADTIEQVVEAKEPTSTVLPTTVQRIKRWWKNLIRDFELMRGGLEYKYNTRFDTHMKPAQIFRILANLHLWVQTRSAWMSTTP